MNFPSSVGGGNASSLPEIEEETGSATFDSAGSVDTCDFIDTGKSRAIDTTKDSTVTALFDVALYIDTFESMQLALNGTGDRVVGAESRALRRLVGLAGGSGTRSYTLVDTTSKYTRFTGGAGTSNSSVVGTADWRRRSFAAVLAVTTLLASVASGTPA